LISVPKAPANQPKFVHQANASKDSKGETFSDHSKGMTEVQRACKLWFDKLQKRGLRGVREEFIESVKKYSPDLSTNECNQEYNIVKNRYDDVYLLDDTRVKVLLNPDNDDYIHASWVKVNSELRYICAQGPLVNTIHQFWLMCIQEEVKVVLQLCQNVEEGKEKCCEYLPKTTSWTTFGPVQVKILKSGVNVPGTKKVTKTTIQCKFEDKENTLTHILYFGWPDHAVAESVPTCREVRNLVHKLYDRKPVVAHCSAGLGRTGSFVAIDMACHKLLNERNGGFSMVELMKDLRNQRMLAVQNDQQYCFIYRCVIEILIAEEGLPKTNEVSRFIQSYEDMLLRKKKARVMASRSAKKRVEPDN